MKLNVIKKQYNSKLCFVCGFDNKYGIQTSFYELEDKSLCALASFKDIHQSYPGRLHGGISASILDETIGRSMMPYTSREVFGVTTSFSIKYKKVVPLNVELRIVGKITNSSGPIYEGTGYLLLPDDSIAVIATGKYLEMPIERIAELDPDNEDDWRIEKNDNDPKEIEMPNLYKLFS